MNSENPGLTRAQISLLVVYCVDLPACLDFYRGLGLPFERERHGHGPEHHAAVLADGVVFELYPAGTGGSTGRTRIGLVVASTSLRTAWEPGVHVLRDPEGRVVELHITA